MIILLLIFVLFANFYKYLRPAIMLHKDIDSKIVNRYQDL